MEINKEPENSVEDPSTFESEQTDDTPKLSSKDSNNSSEPFEKDIVKLPWIVDEYTGITSSVYEAIIVSAHRARQIGRLQKQQIDGFYTSLEDSEIVISEEEEVEEPGIDHFHFPKPTIKALKELQDGNLKFSYTESKENV